MPARKKTARKKTAPKKTTRKKKAALAKSAGRRAGAARGRKKSAPSKTGHKRASRSVAVAAAKPKLCVLVTSLMDDADLRKEFNARPEDVIERFELSEDERWCLLTMNKDEVAEVCAQQIEAFAIPEGEFPPTSINCFPEPGSKTVAYPDPDPGIYRVIPKTAKAGAKDVEVVIHGKSFPPDSRAELRKGSYKKDLGGNLFGTYRCSQLRVVIDRVPGVGVYDLVVLGNNAAPQRLRIEIEGLFEAT